MLACEGTSFTCCPLLCVLRSPAPCSPSDTNLPSRLFSFAFSNPSTPSSPRLRYFRRLNELPVVYGPGLVPLHHDGPTTRFWAPPMHSEQELMPPERDG